MKNQQINVHIAPLTRRSVISRDGKVNRQLGLTLAEQILAVGVGAAAIAVVGFLGMAVYHGISSQNWVSEVQMEQQQALQATTNYPDFSTVTTADMVGSNVFPQGQVSGQNASGRWGGQITMGGGKINSANDAIDETYPQVPSWACQSGVQSLVSFFPQIVVNGTTVFSPTVALNDTTLNTACKANGSNNAVDLYSPRT